MYLYFVAHPLKRRKYALPVDLTSTSENHSSRSQITFDTMHEFRSLKFALLLARNINKQFRKSYLVTLSL